MKLFRNLAIGTVVLSIATLIWKLSLLLIVIAIPIVLIVRSYNKNKEDKNSKW